MSRLVNPEEFEKLPKWQQWMQIHWYPSRNSSDNSSSDMFTVFLCFNSIDVAMKYFILLVLLCVGCQPTETTTIKTSASKTLIIERDGDMGTMQYQLTELNYEGCDYLLIRTGEHCGFTHKGNCNACREKETHK